MENDPSDIILPDTLPVMVLEGCTLFPHCLLPLYIFEPRYREMLATALEGDRMFCIGTVRHGAGDESDDSIHEISTAGLIRACVGQPDGTSHLILQGLHRIRLADWEQREPFRIARIEAVEDMADDGDGEVSRAEAATLAQGLLTLTTNDGTLSAPLSEQLHQLDEPAAIADVIAYNLVRDPQLRQHLLETPDLVERLQSLITYCTACLEQPDGE